MILSDENIEKYQIYKTENGNYRSKIKKKTYKLLQCKYCSSKFLAVDNKRKYCSSSCSAKDTLISKRNTNKQKYGTKEVLSNDEIKIKSQQVKMNRYNNPFYVNPEKANQTKRDNNTYQTSFEKMKQTKYIRYGNPFYVNKDKAISTLLDLYGVDNYFKSDKFKTQYKEYMLDLYGVDNYFKSDKFKTQQLIKQREDRKQRYNNIVIKLIEEGYSIVTKLDDYIENGDPFISECPEGHIQEYYLSNWNRGCRCGKCFGSVSNIENEISDYIESLGFVVERNKRNIISPYELDIYVPSKKIAIEVDGLYWHSETNGKDKNYHLMKTNLCADKDIFLLHIFENEWYEKKEIVKSIIKMKLNINIIKVFARKCVLKQIDNKIKSMFINENHIQGDCPSKYNFGLYFDGELISVMTIGKSRFDVSYEYELLRFCNKVGVVVIGSFSKMLKYFYKHHKGSMVTYADRRYFDGNVYHKNGFKFVKITPPNYWYTKGGLLFNRIQYQKHKLNKKINIFDINKTEYKNMIDNGYHRIWDCGNYKFSININ